MQDSSHLTIILCSSIIKIVIRQKQKVNRKNYKNKIKFIFIIRQKQKVNRKNYYYYYYYFRIPPPPGGTAILPEYIHYYG
jgi:hypothetical protein